MSKNIKVSDLVYYIKGNKLHSAPVLAICRVENQPKAESQAHTTEQKLFFMPFGPTCVKYATCHGIFNEDEVFSTKKELADYILNG